MKAEVCEGPAVIMGDAMLWCVMAAVVVVTGFAIIGLALEASVFRETIYVQEWKFNITYLKERCLFSTLTFVKNRTHTEHFRL